MSKNTAPAVEVEDARAWEVGPLPPGVRYQYSVETWPGQPTVKARVAIVWEPAPGLTIVLEHEGETAHSPRLHHVSGAWIRAGARLAGRVGADRVQGLMEIAQWGFDTKVTLVRGWRPL